jgi:hypothetical protein
MFRNAHLPLIVGLALAGCGGAPGAITVTASNESPSTAEDITVTFRLTRPTDDFVVVVTRTGTPDPEEFSGEALTVEDVGEEQEYTLVIPARRTQRDQIWEFEGRATYGNEVVTSRVEVRVLNSPPTATVRLEPEQPTTLDNIKAVLEVIDPDENPIQAVYRWEVNGEPFFVTTNELPFRVTKRDDVVKVTVQVRDNEFEAEPAVAQVTIQNIAPGEAEVAVQPDPAIDGGPLTCVVTNPAIDEDGDEVSYRFEWTVNDVPWTGVATTKFREGDTVPVRVTEVGELWTCTATPTDGSLDGPSVSSFTEIIKWDGPRIFSNCGKTGREGPTAANCEAAYAGTTLEGEVTVDKGMQIWTAPTGGRFRFSVGGAEGGTGNPSFKGGKGARQEGVFEVEFGDEIWILVGQRGHSEANRNGGGGGGTFVTKRNEDGTFEPMIIAGGGGGIASNGRNDGCGGEAGDYGGRGSGGSTTFACSPKTTKLGLGGEQTSAGRGAGGGGFSGDGADDGWDYGKGGEAFTKGGRGGTGVVCTPESNGGFGGGGAGNGCWGGGGGGGYSGGDSGYVGGGGGSFNAGEEPVRTGNSNEGHGWVIIDRE